MLGKRNLNDVVDEILCHQEKKLRTKTNQYVQIICAHGPKEAPKNFREKRRRGLELTDLVGELDLQQTITMKIKNILL